MTSTTDNRSLVLRAADEIVDTAARRWDYAACFSLPLEVASPPEIAEAREIQQAANIDEHPYFEAVTTSRDALRLWVSQEAVVTGTFSQLLLLVASQMRNVHHRAALLEVGVGEHGAVRNHAATHSHPWLLHLLCESVGLDATTVQPIQPTARFLDALAQSSGDSLRALGAFGVGNELMLIPEYSAMRRAFEKGYPEAAFARFFDANIEEDVEHVRLVELLAQALIAAGGDARQYVEGARVAVSARVKYYDELHSFI